MSLLQETDAEEDFPAAPSQRAARRAGRVSFLTPGCDRPFPPALAPSTACCPGALRYGAFRDGLRRRDGEPAAVRRGRRVVGAAQFPGFDFLQNAGFHGYSQQHTKITQIATSPYLYAIYLSDTVHRLRGTYATVGYRYRSPSPCGPLSISYYQQTTSGRLLRPRRGVNASGHAG